MESGGGVRTRTLRGAVWFRSGAVWWRALLMLLRRPRLWVVAVRQVFRLARPRWWTHFPLLPVPDRAYIEFRMQTAYGSGPARPSDVISYLEWCRDAERARSPRASEPEGEPSGR
jgi:hypothetical protein